MTKRMKNIIGIAIIMLIGISINGFCYEIYGIDVCGEVEIPNVVVKIAEAPINTNWYDPQVTIDSVNNAIELKNMANIIIGCLQAIGSIVSVTVLAILGIKYMVGSAEEKAEYKKTMGPYITGAVMVFAITNLLGIIGKIAQNIFK
ncbi:MAG: hypothetical protein HFJ35_03960 [Clostridia bacterium]|nr:hypothetical protein [Clostridia bacterium]